MMNKTYAVPPPPPHSEGKTVAAWTLNLGLVLGGIIIAFGMVLGHMIAIAVGAVVMVVALIAGVVMSLAGLGQKRKIGRASCRGGGKIPVAAHPFRENRRKRAYS